MEWNRVNRKGFKISVARWDVFPEERLASRVKDGEKFSVFFSKIPDRIKAVDIFNLFGCIGDILEVVIPPRRNKMGKRFDFARFKVGEDVRLLAVKLDNIIIDGKKIHANLPRFNRSEGEEERAGGFTTMLGQKDRKEEGNNARPEEDHRRRETDRNIRKMTSRLFVDAVVNRENKKGGESERFDNQVQHEAKEEDLDKFKKACVGRVHQSGMAYNI